MGETPDADVLQDGPARRLHFAAMMVSMSGIGALLALSVSVAAVSADQLWTFGCFSLDVHIAGIVVSLCRRVGVAERSCSRS